MRLIKKENLFVYVLDLQRLLYKWFFSRLPLKSSEFLMSKVIQSKHALYIIPLSDF